jgi:hypothetical protein
MIFMNILTLVDHLLILMTLFPVIHNFGCHNDVMMMEKSSSSLEHFPEKSYLCLLPEIILLREVRRLPIYLPARMHDSRRLH